jgi:hypothetical protein
LPRPGAAQPLVELETGAVFSGRNEVRIPGDGGTQFSLVNDLDAEPSLYGRVRVGWDFGRHRVALLAAPVRLDAEGRIDRAVNFNGVVFPAGTALRARYQFDTYRLSYRFLIVDDARFQWGLGATALLRDAEIRLEDLARSAAKTDVGVVPLLRLELRYRFDHLVALALDAEGLASPQGRAFDVLTAVEFPAFGSVVPYVGYRFIEGGADNDEVYNFAWLHFAALGVRLEF